MKSSKKDVEKLIDDRIRRGEIKNKEQTLKSVAGHNFQGIVSYTLICNVLVSNLPELVIALRPKQSKKYGKKLEKYTKIYVGNEAQKPDVDIMIYDPTNNDSPVIIYSCKTSLRERAGQTYKWKIMYDLATTNCEYIKQNPNCPINRHKLKFEGNRLVNVGFITADFYDELNNPQLRGMLSFFDYNYVSKPNPPNDLIKKLSEIIGDLNTIFKE